MSHVATIKVNFDDLDALELACEEVGLKLNRGQKTYKWYGQWVGDYHGQDAAYKHGIDPKNYGKCDHAICIPGDNSAYEVGVVKDADGHYRLVWDFWGTEGAKIQKKAGKDCNHLVKAYKVERAKSIMRQQAKSKGWSYSEETNEETGEIEVRVTNYGESSGGSSGGYSYGGYNAGSYSV